MLRLHIDWHVSIPHVLVEVLELRVLVLPIRHSQAHYERHDSSEDRYGG